MGSCVSFQKDKGAIVGEGFSGFRSPGSGSKDEDFFDSQAWLDSDCEDDFFSVNGDFTPSRGSTPNYQTGTPLGSLLNKSFIFDGFPDARLEPSPQKKLAELLQETLPPKPAENEHDIVDGELEMDGKLEGNGTNMDHPPKSLDGTPYRSGTNSVCSGERTPDADFKSVKGKRGKAMQCCLPNLVHSLSFNECKKHTPSRSHHIG